MSDRGVESRVSAEREREADLVAFRRRVKAFESGSIEGHGLYARYQEAVYLVPDLYNTLVHWAAGVADLESTLRDAQFIVSKMLAANTPTAKRRAAAFLDRARVVLGDDEAPEGARDVEGDAEAYDWWRSQQ